MTVRRSAFLLLLMAVALASALTVLPARWLLIALPASWPVALVDASGSVWRGQALVAIGPSGLRRTLPKPVIWQWQWDGGTGPALIARHPMLAGPLPLTVGWRGIQIGAQQARLPASLLAVAGAPLNSIDPSGDLHLSWPDLLLRALPENGPLLTMQWNQAASGRVRVHPLGSYRVAVARQPGGMTTLQLQTLQGQLQLEGQGHHTHSQGWRFDGTAQPATSAEPAVREALAPLLRLIGQREDKIVRLRYPYPNTP
jgi:general secretion pathway protein N